MRTPKNKILIVDDEPDVLDFLSYNFIRKGFEVECACNGIEGIEKVRNFGPHLIITDIMMPGMDGIIMCKILKNHEQHKEIPLIFLSAVQNDYQVMNAGMVGDEYVSKPIKFSLLLSIIEKHLNPFRF